MIGGKLRNLRHGAVVGTSSLRRIAQLRRLRPDLDIRNIRGNVDTRIRKVEQGEYDAIVLAAAGLQRLGWGDIISELFRADIMCPAVAQGALAASKRAPTARVLMPALRHSTTPGPVFVPVTAERSMLSALGGGFVRSRLARSALWKAPSCFSPAPSFSPDGAQMIRYTATGGSAKPSELGRGVAGVLLERGAQAVLDLACIDKPA